MAERSRERWTEADDKWLVDHYATLPVYSLQRRLKRSAKAIAIRAGRIHRLLKLPRREPSLVLKVRQLSRRSSLGQVARYCHVSRSTVAGIIRDHGRLP